MGARRGGVGKKGSWTLPDPSAEESFLPSPSRGNSFPPHSPPGHACPPLPAQAGHWHSRHSPTSSPARGVGWLQAFEDIGTARLNPERISIISEVLGKALRGSRVPGASGGCRLFLNVEGPHLILGVRTNTCREPVYPWLWACRGQEGCSGTHQALGNSGHKTVGCERLWGTE